jgi:hypothetical protein
MSYSELETNVVPVLERNWYRHRFGRYIDDMNVGRMKTTMQGMALARVAEATKGSLVWELLSTNAGMIQHVLVASSQQQRT